MGSNFAHELADYDLGLDLSTAISIHLSSNHYPPVPQSMVLPCIEAIEAYHDDDHYREIKLPEGITYQDRNTAPADAIIEQHPLS